MDFGDAIKLIKQGQKVKRHDWGGYWFMPQHDTGVCVYDKATDGYQKLNQTIIASLKNNGGLAPAQPYMADMLADDWELALDDTKSFLDSFGNPLKVGDYAIYEKLDCGSFAESTITGLDYDTDDGCRSVTFYSGDYIRTYDKRFGKVVISNTLAKN